MHLLQLINGIIQSSARTFEWIRDNNYSKYLAIIIVILGLINGLNQSFFNLANPVLDTSLDLIISIVAYAFGLFILSMILSFVCNLVGPNIDFNDIFKVSVYSGIPGIFYLIFYVIDYFNLGFISQDIENVTPEKNQQILYYFSKVGYFAIELWVFVMLVIGIAKFQGVSYLKAFLEIIGIVFLFIVLFSLFLGLGAVLTAFV